MRLLIIFILVITTEYILRTFVDAYKYHTLGIFQEFFPLVILTVIGGFLYKQKMVEGHVRSAFLKLSAVLIGGFLVAKAILFVQWYYFIAPEYRSVSGDMSEALSWIIFELVIGAFVISVCNIILIFIIKSISSN